MATRFGAAPEPTRPPAGKPRIRSNRSPGNAARWWILVTLGLAQLMVVLDATVVNIALPTAQADLGFTDGERQWVVTAYSLAFGSLLLLGGRLSDHFGRRRAFFAGLVGFAAASALAGAAPTFVVLVSARALQGAFGALLTPAALALLTTTFNTPRERARAFGIFGAIGGAGGAIGLLLGGVLTERYDWRWNLYINVAIAAASLIGGILFLRADAAQKSRPRLDAIGAALVTAALFSLVFGLSNSQADGWTSPLTWGFIAASAVLLTVFALWQQRTRDPLLPLTILRDRDRVAAYVSIAVVGIGMFSIFLFLTYYIQTTLSFTPIQTGVSFLPMIISLIAAAQLSTNLVAPRFGARIVVPAGMLLGAAGMIVFTRLNLTSTYVAGLLPGLVLVGLGIGMIMPAAVQIATKGLAPADAGVASALVNTSQQIGGSIGTALLNSIAATATVNFIATNTPKIHDVAEIHGYTVVYWWGASFYFFGAIVAVFSFRSRPTRAPGKISARTSDGATGLEPSP